VSVEKVLISDKSVIFRTFVLFTMSSYE